MRSGSIRQLGLVAAVAALVSCGPELTEPASTNVTGTWRSLSGVDCVATFELMLSQGADGILTGAWVGVPHDPAHAEDDPFCSLGGPIEGSNTVFQIFVNLVNAGLLTGHLDGSGEIRGTLTRLEQTYTVVFVRD